MLSGLLPPESLRLMTTECTGSTVMPNIHQVEEVKGVRRKNYSMTLVRGW